MVTFLYLCGILSFAWSFLSFATSVGQGGAIDVMPQIYSGTIATAGAVFIVGGAIVEALRKHAGTVKTEIQKATADQRWENIETCLRYLVTVKDQEGTSADYSPPSPSLPPVVDGKVDGKVVGSRDGENIIKCSSCGASIPEFLPKCPSCGNKQTSTP